MRTRADTTVSAAHAMEPCMQQFAHARNTTPACHSAPWQLLAQHVGMVMVTSLIITGVPPPSPPCAYTGSLLFREPQAGDIFYLVSEDLKQVEQWYSGSLVSHASAHGGKLAQQRWR